MGSLHVGRFPTGCGCLPRGRARSEFALSDALLIHLSIPIATHLRIRYLGPIVAAEEHSAVVLGRKEISLLRRCACFGVLTHFKAAHSLIAELGRCAAG